MASSGQRRENTLSQQDTRYVFSMVVVEKLTGLTRRRIRYYEKRGLLAPSRTTGGHRLYSPSNVETLVRIRDIIGSGITDLEAVQRMMAFDMDRAGDTQQRPSPMGDAAVRVMRPVSAPIARTAKGPETDSPSYFRRVNMIADSDRKQNP